MLGNLPFLEFADRGDGLQLNGNHNGNGDHGHGNGHMDNGAARQWRQAVNHVLQRPQNERGRLRERDRDGYGERVRERERNRENQRDRERYRQRERERAREMDLNRGTDGDRRREGSGATASERERQISLERRPSDELSGRLAATAANAIPAVRRLVKELQVMETDPPENTWARPKSMSNLLKWRAKIRGPEGSPYESGIFELALSFPVAYPFEAPIVRFTTPLYHCNVNALGYICVDVLDEQQCWSPGLTVDKLLLSLSALLNDADPLTAYNTEAAGLYLQDREQYDSIARSWTQRHAMDVPWD